MLVEYFKELEEESIRDNFVIIYELMDEMMDFGYPQTTESKILQECVSLPPILSPYWLERVWAGISRKSPTSSKFKYGHQSPSRTRCHGGLRVSGTGRTRSSWMSSRASTCWSVLLFTRRLRPLRASIYHCASSALRSGIHAPPVLRSYS